MRAIAVISATMLFLAAGTAWACPMQSASTGQNQSVASSSDGSSTPIPAKSQGGGNG